MSTPSKRFPVAAPSLTEREERFLIDAVRSGWVSSIGPYVERFERDVAALCEVPHCVAVTNGTDALIVTLKALGLGPGDEVVVPAHTFAAVSASVLHVGATPVLADVHPEHWCIDPRAVERALTPRTRAIIAVHSYGHPAPMGPLLDLAKQRGLKLVEDCAEAHGARYEGKVVGSLGDAGCFSFYGNKIVTCGEGGAVVSKDAELSRHVRYLKDHAQDAGTHYVHSEAGYNCRMTNLQAALGCAQLERFSELAARKRALLGWYQELAGPLPLTWNPKLPWAEPAVWLVSAVLDEALAKSRPAILKSLREQGVETRPFFVCLAELKPYAGCRQVGAGGEADVPVARSLGRRGFNLPSGVELTRDDVAVITAALRRSLEASA